jgi:transaldolase / glucose-6-phosphate isomerase
VGAESYGNDRVFVRVGLGQSERHEEAARVKELAAAGHPVIELNLRDEYDLADTFYVWEFATAVAGSLLGINPFDQPNVQESKDNTKQLLEAYTAEGSLPKSTTVNIDDPGAVEAIGALLSKVKAGDYIALTEYIEESAGHDEIIRKVREHLVRSLHVATTSGYGPRFLHSTGQLHKGGSDQGVFIQITADDVEDLNVPGQKYTFGVLEQAQATGDFQSLEKRNRRALHVHLGHDTYEGLRKLAAAVEQATTVQR